MVSVHASKEEAEAALLRNFIGEDNDRPGDPVQWLSNNYGVDAQIFACDADGSDVVHPFLEAA
jgi:hypothetical protein